MNKTELRRAAKSLEEELDKERSLPSGLKHLRKSLKPVIGKAVRMEINSPVEESSIPGAYQFNEGIMRDFPDLEEAYVEFRIQLSGGVSSTMQSILDSMEGKE